MDQRPGENEARCEDVRSITVGILGLFPPQLCCSALSLLPSAYEEKLLVAFSH